MFKVTKTAKGYASALGAGDLPDEAEGVEFAATVGKKTIFSGRVAVGGGAELLAWCRAAHGAEAVSIEGAGAPADG